MTASGKEVVYVDVDDEITGIIDKVTSSGDKIVALVLPKRATVFQSIVNMKLLKQSADDAKKHLVLITSEGGLMPLAGAVGMHVAKTLQSKPEIPAGPVSSDLPYSIDEDESMSLPNEEFDASKAGEKPIGDLAQSAGGLGTLSAASQMPEETIELDNTDLSATSGTPTDPSKTADVAAMAAGGGAGKSGNNGQAKKDKKLSVPNFDKFRLKLMLGVLILVMLIVGWIVANNVLAKAVVTINTDTTNINSNLTPTLDTAATTVDTAKEIIPAKTEQLQKSYSQQVSASGKQNNGTKASGKVTLSLTDCANNSVTVPAGTGLSTNGLTFITQTSVTLSSVQIAGKCRNSDYPSISSASVSVVSQSGGNQYNVGPSSFTVAGYSDVTASSSDSMSGGTDNIATVVQQSDIDSAKAKAEAGIDKSAVKTSLQQTLKSDGQYVIDSSFTSSTPKVTYSSNAGDQANNVTVTEDITFTMFGVHKDDLVKLVEASVDKQINTTSQAIQLDGIDAATITVPNAGTSSKVQTSVEVTSVVGPHLDTAKLKAAIVGKKSGDVENIIKGNPGIQSVSTKFSPFWVDHIPKNTGKTTIIFEKSSSK